jgi:hypothetical protein
MKRKLLLTLELILLLALRQKMARLELKKLG